MQHFGDLCEQLEEHGWTYIGSKMLSGYGFELPNGEVKYFGQLELKEALENLSKS